ncbi:MAG: Fur family transcriptional regulator [Dehalococcoidia bacterium]
MATQSSETTESTESIERTLASGGFRLTGPRRALVEVMQALGGRFSADDVVEAAPGVGRATVFRTLRLLQDLGIVCQVVLDDGAVAYRLASGGHHHHLVCSECGVVSDFSSGDLEGLLDDIARRTGYQVDAHRLEVYGLCPACRALGA